MASPEQDQNGALIEDYITKFGPVNPKGWRVYSRDFGNKKTLEKG
jgi:hypothetical protein